MSPGHEADRAQDLQHRHLRLDVLSAETLGDDADAVGVSQNVGSALL